MSNDNGTIRLVIITPYKKFFEGDVRSVVVNTVDGQIGFMAGHPPVMVALSPGVSHFIAGEESRYFALSEGYCEVTESVIKIVCNSAEFPEELSPRKTCISYTNAMADLEIARKVEDRSAREVLIKEHEQSIARARARRHLLENYGSDHQKERIAVLVKEYGWKDII